MGKGFRVVVALFMVAVSGPTHAGVKRDVPLLYQTLGARNIPLTVPGTNSSTSLKGTTFDGLRVWVGDYTSGIVYGIDIYSNQVVSQVQLQSTHTAGLAFDGAYVWAVVDGGAVYRFDPNNPPTKSLSPILTDSRIRGWGVAFDGRYLWTNGADAGGMTLAIAVDTTSNPPAVAATVSSTIAWGAVGAVFDGHYVWMANQSGLIKIDPATMTNVFSTGSITGSGGVDFLATDGAYIWLLNRSSGAVQKIDPQTNSIVATLPVVSPWGIAFDGTFMWVGNNSTASVTRIDVRNTTITESHSFPSGFNPYNVVYDGTHIWIIGGAGSNPGSVWKVLVRGN